MEEIKAAMHCWGEDFSFPEPESDIVAVVKELGSHLLRKSGQLIGIYAYEIRVVTRRKKAGLIVPWMVLPAVRLRKHMRGVSFSGRLQGRRH